MVLVATVLCMRDIVPALAHCSKGVVVALWFSTRGTVVIVIADKGTADKLVPFTMFRLKHHLVPFPDYLEWRIACTSFWNNVLVCKELAHMIKRAATLIA